MCPRSGTDRRLEDEVPQLERQRRPAPEHNPESVGLVPLRFGGGFDDRHARKRDVELGRLLGEDRVSDG